MFKDPVIPLFGTYLVEKNEHVLKKKKKAPIRISIPESVIKKMDTDEPTCKEMAN